MIDDIILVFDGNIRRINHLLRLYADLAIGRGRKTTYDLEILRACVVLLHSTLEDYLRNILKWKLPSSGASRLNEVSLAGIEDHNKTKFQLGELIVFRDKTVGEVIDSSIEQHLAKSSFNNTRDLVKFLKDAGIELDDALKNRLLPKLDDMMKRRHHIVHRADRNDHLGYGIHRYRSISVKQVLEWKKLVDRFVLEINSSLR